MTEITSSNDIGPEPKLQWVEVELLNIDSNYQREAIPKHVQAILLGFNWCYFQPPTICPSNGEEYWVIDGQQRVLAAKLHPSVSKVPCYVIDTPLTKDQAAAFIRVNKDRRNVNAVNMYWAGLAAEDEKYLAVQRVLHSAGAEVTQSLGLAKAKTTNAVGSLLLSIKLCKEHNTRAAVQVLCAAKPNDSFTSNMIRALSIVFRDYEGVEKAMMVKLLSRTNFDLLNVEILSMRKIMGGSTVKLLSAEIMKRYLKLKKSVR